VALLSFPSSPTSGQIYPATPLPGQNIYQWETATSTWRLLGAASGATAGTYGNPITVPQITIDATGRITVATNVAIQLADTTQIGLVQLVDNTTSNDATKALTAAQGYSLQNQIGDTSLLNPFAPNLVTAVNAANATTGVGAGTYGNSLNVGRFTVNSQGRITAATNVAIALATAVSPGIVRIGANLAVTTLGVLSVPLATTSAPGATQLVNNTTSNDPAKALTAAQGFSLQQQINALTVSNNLTLAGTLDAATGLLDSVTTEGSTKGFFVGAPLPFPSAVNSEFFVIVTVPGNYIPPGGTSVAATRGDWFLSNGTAWQFLNVGYDAPSATTTTPGIVQLATNTQTQLGINSTAAVTPSSLQSKLSDSTTLNSATSIASSKAVFDLAAQFTALAPKYITYDDISSQFDGVKTVFQLKVATVARPPAPSSNIMVFVGGIAQTPGYAYTVAGNVITFTSAPPTNTAFYATTVGF